MMRPDRRRNIARVACSWAFFAVSLGLVAQAWSQGIRLPANLGPSFGAAPVTPAPGRAGLKPYVAFAWAPTAPLGHVSTMVRFGLDTNPLDLVLASKALPPGCRVFLSASLTNGLLDQREDRCRDAAGNFVDQQGIWPEHGVSAVAALCDRFFGAFTEAGGQCDLISLDFEENYSNWVMAPERLRAVTADPRFPAVAAKLGLPGTDNPEQIAQRLIDWRNSNGLYLKWNSVTDGFVADAVNRAIGGPLWRHLPAAGFCNFDSCVVTPANAFPDSNGNMFYDEGPMVGNYQCPSISGVVGNIAIVGIPGDWKAPFTSLLHSANLVRACVRSSNAPVLTWVCYRSWPGDEPGHPVAPYGNTDYWQESLYHALLSGGTTNVFYFNPRPDHQDIFAKPKPGVPTLEDDQAVDAALAEIEQQAHGHVFSKPLFTQPVAYTDQALVSAAKTDEGRMVARVSFAAGVEAADVKIAGQTIHVMRPAGRVGAWVNVP